MSHNGKKLSPEAERAIAEAEDRRKNREDAGADEIGKGESGGPRGEEPTRFGDWERKGIAYDF